MGRCSRFFLPSNGRFCRLGHDAEAACGSNLSATPFMEFFVYETGETVKARRRPIVVITSNNEKELPDAFLRRCFFHYIRFPDADTMIKGI